MLYDIDIPCIHMILNEKWEEDISQFLLHLSINELTFNEPLQYFEIPDPTTNEDNDDENQNECENSDADENAFLFEENIIKKVKFYDDPIQQLIYQRYKQLNRI